MSEKKFSEYTTEELLDWLGHYGELAQRFADKQARIEALQARIEAIKKTVAHYMVSEGCSCCEGPDHAKFQEELCALLEFPEYDDGSGFDYFKVSREALLEADK